MARIWQLHRSLQEIKRKMRTKRRRSSLWYSISRSDRDRNPPSLCFFRADSFCGHKLWFLGKRIVAEGREKTEGAVKWWSHLLCASESLSKQTRFATTKDYFQWGRCITNEMHIPPRCGCRNVNRRLISGAIGSRKTAGKPQSWTEIAVVEWHLKQHVWIPGECVLFSSGNESLYPKGHTSSALSPECAELIIHARRCNNQTTKGSYKEPGSLRDDALERATKTGLDQKEARSEIFNCSKTQPCCEPRATCGSPVSWINHRSQPTCPAKYSKL